MSQHVRQFEESKQVPFAKSYAVTESGKVGKIGKDGWLKPCRAKRGGYLIVNLWEGNKGRPWPVHQIVAITFHGPRPSPKHDTAHTDGNKENNHWSNLRWATRSENELDKIAHGTSNRGERNGSAKITNAQAADIRERAKNLPRSSGGVKLKKGTLIDLAAEYHVTTNAIWQIINGYRRLET